MQFHFTLLPTKIIFLKRHGQLPLPCPHVHPPPVPPSIQNFVPLQLSSPLSQACQGSRDCDAYGQEDTQEEGQGE